MRRISAAVAVALLSTSVAISSATMISGAAFAETAERAAVRNPVITSVIAAVEARLAVEKNDGARNWLSEMEGFYRAPGAKPLWVNEAGLTQAGADAIGELLLADTYGLDRKQFDLPDTTIASDPASLAAAEVRISFAATKYAWHARGGRVDPSDLSLWLDQSPRTLYASDVLANMSKSYDAAAALRAYQPQHPEFEFLRRAYLTERGDISPVAVEQIPTNGPKLAIGDRHPDISIARRRLNIAAADPANDDLFDSPMFRAMQTYMYEAGFGRKRAFDDQVRTALNKTEPNQPGVNRAKLNKMLVNLERWRWMPEKLGTTHIWNNLPEFLSRVIVDDQVIHEERIIVGTPATQTPVFSDVMSHVIFQPEWGVPESIKIRQLLPRLKAGDYSVLDRRDMKVLDDRGRKIEASRIRWAKADIGTVSIVQGSGPGNPLGRLKFIFPNGHDVYMHDTPDKGLFADTERTFSHGCMRLRNPDRYAEVVLGLDRGWTGADVKRQLGVKATTQIDLKRPIPIHITYFTMTADEKGNVASFKDMYGHDKRILDALTGARSVAQIAAADPAMVQKRENKILEESASYIPRSKLSSRSSVKVASIKGLPPSFFGFAPPKLVYAKPPKQYGKPYYLKKPSFNPGFFGYFQ